MIEQGNPETRKWSIYYKCNSIWKNDQSKMIYDPTMQAYVRWRAKFDDNRFKRQIIY